MATWINGEKLETKNHFECKDYFALSNRTFSFLARTTNSLAQVYQRTSKTAVVAGQRPGSEHLIAASTLPVHIRH